MPEVTYLHPDGSATGVQAPVGTTIQRAAALGGVDGIVAECGGNLMCATCHVYVDEGWLSRLPAREPEEGEMLCETACKSAPNSRLACQLVMDPKLDGIVVSLPERQI